jgi:hypothetical protein
MVGTVVVVVDSTFQHLPVSS